MAQISDQSALEMTRRAIAKAIIEQKPAIISAMRRNGIIVSPTVGDRDLSIMIFEAIQRSKKFQQDLYGILYNQTQVPGFFNQTGDDTEQASGDKRTAWTQLAALGLDAGLKLISNRINAKQADKDRLNAIQYNASEVERLKAQLEFEQKRKENESARGQGKMMTYVVIGAVALVAVSAVVIYMKNKKK
jgi:hypothetical protein